MAIYWLLNIYNYFLSTEQLALICISIGVHSLEEYISIFADVSADGCYADVYIQSGVRLIGTSMLGAACLRCVSVYL